MKQWQSWLHNIFLRTDRWDELDQSNQRHKYTFHFILGCLMISLFTPIIAYLVDDMFLSRTTTLIGCFLLAGISYLLIIFGIEHTVKQLQEQSKRITLYEKQVVALARHREQVHCYIHDLKNHLLVNEAGHGQSGMEPAHDEPIIEPSPNTLEILIEIKTNQAKKRGVSFVFLSDRMIAHRLSHRDIVCLFGNLFDNAINAAAKIKGGKVDGYAKCIKGMVIIRMINSSPLVLFYRGLPMRRKNFGMGYGISIIRAIVKKYHGNINYSQQDKRINLDIILYPSIMNTSRGESNEMSCV